MTYEEVLSLYQLLEMKGIAIWIDGGWCIDALIGQETRNHADLDIAVERKDNKKLRILLEAEGFTEKIRNDTKEWMYVLKHDDGRQIDVHVFAYDKNGKNIYGIEYPFGSLNGSGVIGRYQVNCINPESMLKFKTAYEPNDKDIQDVQNLCKKFGFNLPQGYTSS